MKLFIGGLAGSITSESMRDFFSQFGKVINSTVMLDRETGRSKGFGFVSFEDTKIQHFVALGIWRLWRVGMCPPSHPPPLTMA